MLLQTIRLGGLLFETADSEELNYRAELRDAMLRAVGSSRYAIYHHLLPKLLQEEDPSRWYQPSSPISPVAEDGTRLSPVEQEVVYGEGTVEQAKRIIEAQVAPPKAPLVSAIPAGTKLKAVFVTDKGEVKIEDLAVGDFAAVQRQQACGIARPGRPQRDAVGG